MNDLFRKFAHSVSQLLGNPWSFVIAILVILTWVLTGPIFHYSDTWQLIINTGTTIVTFLIVFLIQNAQNRDAKAIQLKLDELLRGVRGARNSLMNLEDMTDAELSQLQHEFKALKEKAIKAEALKMARAQAKASGQKLVLGQGPSRSASSRTGLTPDPTKKPSGTGGI